MLVTREQCGLKPPRSVNRNISSKPMNTLHYGGDPLGGFPWSHGRCASVWRAWQNYHFSRGWADIAYTAGVCIHGDVYVGRWWKTRTAAQGTNSGNQQSLAVCYIAGVGEPLTDAAKLGFHDYFNWSRSQGNASELVMDHRDWHSTSCPGNPLVDWHAAGFPHPHPAPQPEPNIKGEDVSSILIKFVGKIPAEVTQQAVKNPNNLFLLSGRVKSQILDEDEFWDHVSIENMRMREILENGKPTGKQEADLQVLNFDSSSAPMRSKAIRIAKMPLL